MHETAELIMKLRLVVGRFGEMDRAGWWNTQGMLASIGENVISRGFPKSQFFARARAVFAVAAQRCDEVFDAPDAFTLWELPAEVEELVDDGWQQWLEHPEPWCDFLSQVEDRMDQDLLDALVSLELVDGRIVEQVQRLRRGDDLRSVRLPKVSGLEEVEIGLLAAAFSRGEPKKLAVPFVQLEEVAV